MIWLHIVEPLVRQDLAQELPALRGGTPAQELIQNRLHLILRHGAAVQQDFAHRQQLPAGEKAPGGGGQLIPLLLRLV